MILTFNRAGVEKMLAHTLEAKEHNRTFDTTGKPKPSLWLVGDQGIYLMSNGKPGLRAEDPENPERQFVVYANECNPDRMAFDDWWDIKQRSFGGDDGVETIDATSFQEVLRETTGPLRMSVTASMIAFAIPKPGPAKASKLSGKTPSRGSAKLAPA